MSNTYELKPRYISQKSFYKKAFVTVTNYSADVCYCLRSYNTYVVSLYVGRDGIPYVKKLWKGYSVKQVGYVITGKAEFDKGDYSGWSTQYIDLWVTILTVVDTVF